MQTNIVYLLQMGGATGGTDILMRIVQVVIAVAFLSFILQKLLPVFRRTTIFSKCASLRYIAFAHRLVTANPKFILLPLGFYLASLPLRIVRDVLVYIALAELRHYLNITPFFPLSYRCKTALLRLLDAPFGLFAGYINPFMGNGLLIFAPVLVGILRARYADKLRLFVGERGLGEVNRPLKWNKIFLAAAGTLFVVAASVWHYDEQIGHLVADISLLAVIASLLVVASCIVAYLITWSGSLTRGLGLASHDLFSKSLGS